MERTVKHSFYEKYIKRILDIGISSVFMLVFSWLYIIVALLVRIKLGSPVLFHQERIGLGEKPFKLFKFRSMTDERDADGNLLPDEKRLTKFGAKLRSTCLDELPEMISILKGDMSVVGPRPLPCSYLKYFKEEERVIHTVKGGFLPPDVLTGHSVFDWDEQFKNEIDYVNNISFATDFKIVIATIKILFVRKKENYGGAVRKSLVETRADMEAKQRN